MPSGRAISARRRKRTTLRRMYGNPWDSPRASPRRTRRSRSSSKSKSTTSSAHAAWRSVSSKR